MDASAYDFARDLNRERRCDNILSRRQFRSKH